MAVWFADVRIFQFWWRKVLPSVSDLLLKAKSWGWLKSWPPEIRGCWLLDSWTRPLSAAGSTDISSWWSCWAVKIFISWFLHIGFLLKAQELAWRSFFSDQLAIRLEKEIGRRCWTSQECLRLSNKDVTEMAKVAKKGWCSSSLMDG